jgi:hypothetical protein
MLPFLKDKLEGSASSPVETKRRDPDEGSEDYSLLDSVAEDLLTAIEKKDHKLLRSALEAFQEHLQAEDEIKDAETFGDQQ